MAVTESVEFQVRNSLGRIIVDVRDRNFEAVAWGSVEIPGINHVRAIEWPRVDCPLVFMRCSPSYHMYRSQIWPDAGSFGTKIHVSAAGPTTIHYVVAGFRRQDEFVGKEGLFMLDGKGRVAFDSGRRYLRLTNPPPAFVSSSASEPSWRLWSSASWSHAGKVIPAHPAWTSSTYFCWRPNWCYNNDVDNHWYQGFGVVPGTAQIEIQRFSATVDLHDVYGIGAYTVTNPGNLLPNLLLTCEFAP